MDKRTHAIIAFFEVRIAEVEQLLKDELEKQERLGHRKPGVIELMKATLQINEQLLRRFVLEGKQTSWRIQ